MIEVLLKFFHYLSCDYRFHLMSVPVNTHYPIYLGLTLLTLQLFFSPGYPTLKRFRRAGSYLSTVCQYHT
jgi:hypothetical protein